MDYPTFQQRINEAANLAAAREQQRALELGFRPMKNGEAEYLVVAGYAAFEPDILSSASHPQLSALSIPREYNESLLDWMDEKISASPRGLR